MTDSNAVPTTAIGDHGTLGGLISGKTWGVQNIEAAYSRAGGATNHTPGYASKLGSQEQPKGVDSKTSSDAVTSQKEEVGPILSLGSALM